MKLSFRQGIIRKETNASPALLTWHSMAHDSVDLNVGLGNTFSPISVAFGHYGSNYVVDETKDVDNAWIGFPTGVNVYLYWDIDLATGALSRGWTTIPWVQNSVEPINPVNNLHWWDNTNTRMRVYRKPTPASTGVWQDKVRVFVGWIQNGSTLHTYPLGSQVGITGKFDGGNLILGANNVPLKQQNGTFVTTATDLIIQQTTGQNVQFDAALVFAEAAEEIPAFTCVAFRPYKMINLAGVYEENSVIVERFANGISVQSLAQEEVGQIVSNGVIRNDQWMWEPEQIGRPLFCGPLGEVQLTPPLAGFVQQIGTVFDTDAIYLNIFPPVRIS